MNPIHALTIAALALGACSKTAEPTVAPVPTQIEADQPTTAAESESSPTSPETEADTAPPPTEAPPPVAPADDVPRIADFPDIALVAEVGMIAFAPTRQSIDRTKADPAYERPSYQVVTIVEIGPAVSKVKPEYAEPELIPNAYILPVSKATSIAVGDLLLAADGAFDISLAVVTETGDQPKADFVEQFKYEDIHIAEIVPGRFIKLDGTLKPGAHVAAKVPDKGIQFAYVISMSDDKVMLAGFMGRVEVANRADVTPLETTVAVAVGDKVTARFASGEFMAATVKAVDEPKGLIMVDFDELPDPEPSAIPAVYVTKRLP